MIISYFFAATSTLLLSAVHIEDKLPRDVAGSPTETVVELSRSYPNLFRMDALDTLVHVSEHPLYSGTVVRAQRARSGVPVWNQWVAVRLNSQGVPQSLQSDFDPLSVQNEILIAADEAKLRAAAVAYGVDVPEKAVGPAPFPATLVILPTMQRYAYRVQVPGFLPWQQREIFVDASSGAILQVESPVKHAVANAYNPMPAGNDTLATPEAVVLPRLIEPAENEPWRTIGEYAASHSCMTGNQEMRVRTCQDVLGALCAFAGDMANLVVPFCGDGHRAITDDPAEGFAFAPDDDLAFGYPQPSQRQDPFAEVHAYFHLDKIVEWVDALGHTSAEATFIMANVTMPNPSLIQCASAAWAAVPDKSSADPRDVVIACLNGVTDFLPLDNAFYLHENPGASFDPATLLDVHGGIYMGQGSAADFAYDGTVIYHEFGHGLAAALGTFGSGANLHDAYGLDDSPGALNEGFADYLAGALSEQPNLGGYVGTRMGLAGNTMRTLDHDLVCPNYWVGEVHTDGQGMAGALWEARSQFTQTTGAGELTIRYFDRAIVDAMKLMTADVSHEAAYNAVVSAVKGIPELADEDGELISEILQARNLADCRRVRWLQDDGSTIEYINVSGAGGGGGAADMFGGSTTYIPHAPPHVQFAFDPGVLVASSDTQCIAFEGYIGETGSSFEDLPDFMGEGGSAPNWQFKLLQSNDGPVQFSYSASGNNITVNDTADAAYNLTLTGNKLTADIQYPKDASVVHLAVVNATPQGTRLAHVRLKACKPAADDDSSGSGAGDGQGESEDGSDSQGPSHHRASQSKGCNSAGTGPAWMLTLGLLLAMRRRVRREA